MVTVRVAPLAGERIVKLTEVPLGPAIFLTTWKRLRPATSSLSTLTMMSPGSSPAFWAGEPSKGATITTWPSFILTSAPMPTYSPLICSFSSSIIWGVRKVE